ncbi:MarR family winged helix-turn-helix transcriptional regulator [Nakamurella sp.]|uniref:MarR family winged helix-turn-helix transcriptional regulator n=1 Tax=Nakamurella sp. TaxID=1869182 RepID=UPI003B3AC2C4
MTTSPRWLTEPEQRAWRALQQFGAPLAAALNRQLLAESALSSADYQVLVVLTETEGGVLRAGELGRETGWEKSRLSHHLKRMEARGLVRRDECLTDGRGLLVRITPAGRQAIAEAAPGHVAAVRDLVIDALTPEQLRVLAEAGEAVGARLTAVNCGAADAEAADEGNNVSTSCRE